MDFTTANQILAVVGQLVDQERFEVLNALQAISEWNELVTEATEV